MLEREDIARLAGLAGIEVRAEDQEFLAVALHDQLAAIAVMLELDLEGVDPAVHYDPRWDRE